MTTRSPYGPTRLALTGLALAAGLAVGTGPAAAALAGGPPHTDTSPGGSGSVTPDAALSLLPGGAPAKPGGEPAAELLAHLDVPPDWDGSDWDEGWYDQGRDFTWYQRRGYRWDVGYGWGRWRDRTWVPCPRPVEPPPPCRACEVPEPPVSESPAPAPTTTPPATSAPEPEPSEPETTEPVDAPTRPAVIVPVDNPGPSTSPPAPAPEIAPPVAEESLPVTGVSAGWVAAGGSISLLLGTGLMVATRRRHARVTSV